MPRPHAVLFDLDDTLLDHASGSRETVEEVHRAFEVFGKRPVEELGEMHNRLLEEIHVEVACGRMTLQAGREERYRRMLVAYGVAESVAAQKSVEVARHARAYYMGRRKLIPGARELLAELKGQAVVGIVTNNTLEEQTEKLATFGLGNLVDFMVVSESVGCAKPDRRIFHEALRRAGCDGDRAAMVGDSWPADIRGALGAGIGRVVWFNRHGKARPEPAEVLEVSDLEPTGRVMQVLGF
jgi:HAD superfamily hydrolase (TIGR01549 family)